MSIVWARQAGAALSRPGVAFPTWAEAGGAGVELPPSSRRARPSATERVVLDLVELAWVIVSVSDTSAFSALATSDENRAALDALGAADLAAYDRGVAAARVLVDEIKAAGAAVNTRV